MSEAVLKPSKFLAFSRHFLLWAGLVGFLFFAGLFAATFADRQVIERAGQSFIKYQVKQDFQERNNALADSKYGDQLEALKDRFGGQADRMQGYLDSNADDLIASAIASMCNLDCDKRESVRQIIRSGMDERLSKLGASSATVEDWIKGKYTDVLTGLTRDVRIFLGTNAVLFLLVLLAILAKRKASIQLLIPAGLLVLSSLIMTGFYIFGQNWFFTLLYSNFWGFAYTAWVGIIFVLLADVILNKARVTSFIANIIGNIIGSVSVVVPC